MTDITFHDNAVDTEAFSFLRESCGLSYLPEEAIEIALAGSYLTILALWNGRPAGMLRVVSDGIFVFMIFDVMVHPKYRRQGIGAKLVERAIVQLKSRFPEGYRFTINLFAGSSMEGFYERLGFRTLPDGVFGPGMQLIV